MKLRNKKTGEIVDGGLIFISACTAFIANHAMSVTEVNDTWEDYDPKEPLIKDEKIRKAVRAWADANNINSNHYYETDVSFDSVEHCLTWIDTSIQFNEITGLENLEGDKKYTIEELCGEE